MDNKEIIQRSIKGWRQKISLLENSSDTVDHMRSALRQVAEMVRNEYWVEGNQRLGENLLSILPGLDDQQIRDLHRKWQSDAHKALKSSEEVAQQLGYSTSTASKCFIATAACGAISEEVTTLRCFRDVHLQTTIWGRAFIRIYYFISPPIAGLIQASPRARYFVRHVLIRPVVRLLLRTILRKE
jgi:hypothetical protein